jgi:type IV secretion system protein VirB10
VKGRGELQVQFDSLTLPNGVSRTFHSDLGAVDARSQETLNREKSKINGPSDTGRRAGTVAATTASGAALGTAIGDATGHIGRGIGVGAGAGAAAGALVTMMSRRPDATLAKGSTVEMVLDRPISFNASDLNFSNAPPRSALSEGSDPAPQKKSGWTRRLPY